MTFPAAHGSRPLHVAGLITVRLLLVLLPRGRGWMGGMGWGSIPVARHATALLGGFCCIPPRGVFSLSRAECVVCVECTQRHPRGDEGGWVDEWIIWIQMDDGWVDGYVWMDMDEGGWVKIDGWLGG